VVAAFWMALALWIASFWVRGFASDLLVRCTMLGALLSAGDTESARVVIDGMNQRLLTIDAIFAVCSWAGVLVAIGAALASAWRWKEARARAVWLILLASLALALNTLVRH